MSQQAHEPPKDEATKVKVEMFLNKGMSSGETVTPAEHELMYMTSKKTQYRTSIEHDETKVHLIETMRINEKLIKSTDSRLTNNTLVKLSGRHSNDNDDFCIQRFRETPKNKR